MNLYAVKDVKSGVFSVPFASHTHGTAERMFGANVNDRNPQNMMNKHPADFELWFVGTFDERTGVVHEVEIAMCSNGAQLVEVMN